MSNQSIAMPQCTALRFLGSLGSAPKSIVIPKSVYMPKGALPSLYPIVDPGASNTILRSCPLRNHIRLGIRTMTTSADSQIYKASYGPLLTLLTLRHSTFAKAANQTGQLFQAPDRAAPQRNKHFGDCWRTLGVTSPASLKAHASTTYMPRKQSVSSGLQKG